MPTARSIPCVVASLLLTVTCGAGCASDGGEQAKERAKAITSMRETREQLVEAKQQINVVLQAMNQLALAADPRPEGRRSAPPGVRPAYERFAKAVEETEEEAGKANRRASEMRVRGREYVAEWEKEMDTITNPDLRAGAAERRQLVRENYNQIRDAARAAREAYNPFIRGLRDLRRALSMDITPEGVRAAQPAMDATRADGENLQLRIDELIAEIDRVRGDLSSRHPPPQS
jgi:hypothetical protein